MKVEGENCDFALQVDTVYDVQDQVEVKSLR